MRRGAGVSVDQVLVTFPNGETRRMKPGPSAEITKAVVEVFALAFLTDPAVVFPRSQEVAQQSANNLTLFFGDAAPRSVADMFARLVNGRG